ncbi:MAG: hypothetical protein KAU28_08300, partial [Phycisphaerae bacterium]|nr:hypothetical protein [Phycisphaerae bacterium]
MTGAAKSADRPIVPPPQHNLATAVERALALVRKQPAEQLQWLGARRDGDLWALPVLNDVLSIELAGGEVQTSALRKPQGTCQYGGSESA